MWASSVSWQHRRLYSNLGLLISEAQSADQEMDDPLQISIFYIAFGILYTDFGSPNTWVQQSTTRLVRIWAPALWGEVEGSRHVKPEDKTAPEASNKRPSVPLRLPSNGGILTTAVHSGKTLGIGRSQRHRLDSKTDFCTLRIAVHWSRLAREAVQDMSCGFQDQKSHNNLVTLLGGEDWTRDLLKSLLWMKSFFIFVHETDWPWKGTVLHPVTLTATPSSSAS